MTSHGCRNRQAIALGLVLTLLVSGCGGASPETRATETLTALHGTSTPTPLQAARTAIARGTFTGIDQNSAAILTAEAVLPVARSLPTRRPAIMVGTTAATPGP